MRSRWGYGRLTPALLRPLGLAGLQSHQGIGLGSGRRRCRSQLTPCLLPILWMLRSQENLSPADPLPATYPMQAQSLAPACSSLAAAPALTTTSTERSWRAACRTAC